MTYGTWTGNLNLFSSLDTSVKTNVTLGNNVVLGKGTIDILTKQGESKYILDVYHVEGLKHNLLSIGQFSQKGYRFYMEDEHCVIKDKRPSYQLIAKALMKRNRLFPLRIVPEMKGKTNIGASFMAKSKEAVEYLNNKENDSADF